jgi:hypothetical protein
MEMPSPHSFPIGVSVRDPDGLNANVRPVGTSPSQPLAAFFSQNGQPLPLWTAH